MTNSKMLTGSIDLTKIDKSVLFKSEKTGHIFLNVVMFLNEEKDKYGNSASIMQSYPKDKRPEKPVYLGNLKYVEASAPVAVSEKEVEDDLPF